MNVAEAADAPLTRAELVAFVRTRAQRAETGDRRVALRAVLSELRRPDYARLPGQQAIDLLVQNQWKLEAQKTPRQLIALNEAVTQLMELPDSPASVRAYIAANAPLQADGRAESSQPAADPRSESARALADEVSRSAAGSVVVHTSQVRGTTVRYRSGSVQAPRSGLYNFGDGIAQPASETSREVRDAWRAAGRGMYEGVAFVPATEQLYRTEQYVARRRVFGQDELGTRNVRDGTRPMMVDGPQGSEPGVHFGYAFDPNQRGGRPGEELPMYGDTASPRRGNMLMVQAVLPGSVADRLHEAIEQDPTLARVVAERLVLRNGGLDPAAWEGRGDERPMRPPWAHVPASEPIHLVTQGSTGAPVIRTLHQSESIERLADQVEQFTGSGQARQASTGQRSTDGSREYQPGQGWSNAGSHHDSRSGGRAQ
ncbi:hypothetical protein [Kribbella sp. NPDC004536]|uniref:hypothetical protein n=1 Tax=Kribbella sp. NPDC004536 TaxID=3364106 RepID=UPI0036A11BCE